MESNKSIGNKKTVKNILKVSASNIIKLLAGVLVGFLLPKIIGVTDYGYYKTFTLYATYIGLFHFGIEDGVYLKYGGKNYEELDKENFRFYTAFLIGLEGVISVIAFIISFFSLSGDSRFIFCFLAATLFATNITNYYQFISQITQRFQELSTVIVVQAALTAVAMVVLWVLHHFWDVTITYKIYTIIFVAIYYLITLWYFIAYRDISFGKRSSFKEHKGDIWEFIKLGFPLMVANLCACFILTIDRQFVNIFFDMDTYAVYAFAYNMLGLATTAISAISTVIYPAMKRADEETLKKNYSKLVALILGISFFLVLLYYPLCFFIHWFLPKYSGSLPIFRVILPSLAISSAVTIVMHNYYKTIGKNLSFFWKSLVILALSIGADFIAYYCFKTTIAISIASLFVMFFWYILIDYYFVKTYHTKWLKNLLYLVSSMGSFYLITWIPNDYIGFAVHIVSFFGITLAFFHKAIFSKIASMKNKKKEKTEDQ